MLVRAIQTARLRAFGVWFALALVCSAAPALAEPEAAAEVGAEAVPLNRLLRLPAGSGVGSQVERHGGHTKPQWQTRFRDAREAHSAATEAIALTREKIEKKVLEDGGGAWRMGAPGLGSLQDAGDGGDSPLDYQLTQRLRRNREELARAERELQDLEVEANLASVPPDWRAMPTPIVLE